MCQTALYVGWAASATLGVWGSLPFHGPPPALAPAFLQHPSPTHVPSSKSSSSSLPLRPGPHSLARIRLPWPKSPSPCRPPPPSFIWSSFPGTLSIRYQSLISQKGCCRRQAMPPHSAEERGPSAVNAVGSPWIPQPPQESSQALKIPAS